MARLVKHKESELPIIPYNEPGHHDTSELNIPLILLGTLLAYQIYRLVQHFIR